MGFCRNLVARSVPVVLFFLVLTSAHRAAAEKLTYDLTWTGIKAGTAIQEYVAEKDTIRIVSTARSADWISAFFPVEDQVISILTRPPDGSLGLPLNFRMKISEGKTRRDREIIFDAGRGRARYVDHMKGEKLELEIPGRTYDTYSGFHYLRRLPLQPGKSVYVNILDNKKLWNVEVEVLKKEKISSPVLGEVNTILIKPLMKSDGFFERKGEIYVWLTDDWRRVPVKMKTKVRIGSVTATLVKAEW